MLRGPSPFSPSNATLFKLLPPFQQFPTHPSPVSHIAILSHKSPVQSPPLLPNHLTSPPPSCCRYTSHIVHTLTSTSRHIVNSIANKHHVYSPLECTTSVHISTRTHCMYTYIYLHIQAYICICLHWHTFRKSRNLPGILAHTQGREAMDFPRPFVKILVRTVNLYEGPGKAPALSIPFQRIRNLCE